MKHLQNDWMLRVLTEFLRMFCFSFLSILSCLNPLCFKASLILLLRMKVRVSRRSILPCGVRSEFIPPLKNAYLPSFSSAELLWTMNAHFFGENSISQKPMLTGRSLSSVLSLPSISFLCTRCCAETLKDGSLVLFWVPSFSRRFRSSTGGGGIWLLPLLICVFH